MDNPANYRFLAKISLEYHACAPIPWIEAITTEGRCAYVQDEPGGYECSFPMVNL